MRATLQTSGMGDFVWTRVNGELERRRASHLYPGTWAALGREIGASDQQMHNWSKRGIPAKHHATIALAFGWSVDRLLGVEQDLEGRTPAADEAVRSEPDILPAHSIAAALDFLAKTIANMDEHSRDMAVTAMVGTIKQPERRQHFLRAIEALLADTDAEEDHEAEQRKRPRHR